MNIFEIQGKEVFSPSEDNLRNETALQFIDIYIGIFVLVLKSKQVLKVF